MKLSILFFALVLVVGISVSASATLGSHTGQIYNGWNLLAVDGVPYPSDPALIFPSGVRISGPLYRWEAATQSQIRYDEYQPELFGNMLLGDGYWLCSETETPFSYDAFNDTDSMDIWISLPKAGWTMMGSPFSYQYPWENAKVTDGNVNVSMQVAAKTNNWLNSIIIGWDAEYQNQLWIGLPDDYQPLDYLTPKNGFWVVSYQDKLALILDSIP